MRAGRSLLPRCWWSHWALSVLWQSHGCKGCPKTLYFIIGLITIIGLSAKNAILIIEFAKESRARGKPLVDATVEAAQSRLRPILMTSLAFILGVVPLVIATGASAKSQHALGTGVLGGMITGTVLAIFMVPIFFVTVMNFVCAGQLLDREQRTRAVRRGNRTQSRPPTPPDRTISTPASILALG